jgi:nucleoside-diphosphate-sugar epimerase
MRILITGAGGYIGTTCVRAFAEHGWDVRAATRSRSFTSAAPGVEVTAIESLDGRTSWSDHLQGVDVVLHLAGVAHRPDTNVATYRQVNVEATSNLAYASARAGVSRFVFVSSMAVYGRNCGSKLIDEMTPLTPNDAYGQSKMDAEEAIVASAEGHTMNWVVVRLPLVYGPGAPGNFRRLVGLVRSGLPLPLSAARSPRSYVGLDNLTSALVCVARHPAAANQCFVVTDGEDVSTVQLIRWIAEGMGRHPRLWWIPEELLRFGAAAIGRGDDAARLLDPLRSDSGRIREALGWRPPLSPKEGVLRSVAPMGVEVA